MPEVSVLIATYQRCGILQRAIDSVLKQDFEDFELIIVDDCSPDATPEVVNAAAEIDSRIRYIRLPKNVGSKLGDREIFRRFVYEWSTGEYFIYLCDDDFWVSKSLLSRAMGVMKSDPSVVQVMGGQVQIYPDPVRKIPHIEEPWNYEWVPGIANGLFMKGIFPDGLIPRDDFLDLQAQMPVTRNILTGASVYRRSAFERAGVFQARKASRWQAGYELTTGVGTQGNSYYFDKPSIAANVDIGSASFRGTQLLHMNDCLVSIDIAFSKPLRDADPYDQLVLRYFEKKMKHAIIFNYVRNKLGYQLGWFGDGTLLEMRKIFKPEIRGWKFLQTAIKHGVPLSRENLRLLALCSLPSSMLPRYVKREIDRYGVHHWHREMSKWADDQVEVHLP
ncbi:MAG: glycosyltransferase family 2 protein [Alphaproteobacteria bacterium]